MSSALPFEVQRVAVLETVPLRQRILRPHQTIEEMARPGDDGPETGHFAAKANGEVIGTVSVRPEPPPWAPDQPASWRLRGMATDERWRGKGVGAAVLGAAVKHVRTHGGKVLWCNARTPAVAFYKRAGWVTLGEPWEEPMIGPHIAMELVGMTATTSDSDTPEGYDEQGGSGR